MPSSLRPRRSVLALTALALLAAAACATAYLVHDRRADAGLTPGPFAGAAPCRSLTGRAPGRLADLDRRAGSVRGVVVWGDRDVVLRCGVTPPQPRQDACFSVNGVDWVIDEKQSTASRKVIVTYGRTPATQVAFFTTGRTDTALVDLSDLVTPIRQADHCLDK
ncbi:DUF3515 family protein [Streptomyces sp. NPDC127190]|uniref:DUF3515 family protein n=1 Tax=unclassified Streptomyces TaxID=2593676 RepID=UPI0036310608